MRLINSYFLSNLHLSAGFVELLTLPTPAVDAARYAVELRLINLAASFDLTLREVVAGFDVDTEHFATGLGEACSLTFDRSVNFSDAALVISLKDAHAGTTAAEAIISIYRVDEDQLPPSPPFLIPQNATNVPMLFRVGRSAPAVTPTATLLKNGAGAYVTAAGAISSLTDGWFKLTPTALDTATEGPLLLRARLGAGQSQVTTYTPFQIFHDTAAADIAHATETALADEFEEVLDAIGGAGTPAGSTQYVVNVSDGTDPLDNAEVWVTSDEAGEHVVDGRIYSDAAGNATFLLDPGTYYAWAEHGGKVRVTARLFTVA
jgi:hypothetical protein